MRNYRIINNYKVTGKPNFTLYACYTKIKDLKSNLYYLVWVDDYSAICYDHDPLSPKGVGYMKFLGEAYIFEEDDIIPYIYS